MSSSESDDEKKNISVRVQEDKVNKFDRTIKKLQIRGDLPMSYSRAKALRHLIDAAIQDPSLLEANGESE